MHQQQHPSRSGGMQAMCMSSPGGSPVLRPALARIASNESMPMMMMMDHCGGSAIAHHAHDASTPPAKIRFRVPDSACVSACASATSSAANSSDKRPAAAAAAAAAAAHYAQGPGLRAFAGAHAGASSHHHRQQHLDIGLLEASALANSHTTNCMPDHLMDDNGACTPMSLVCTPTNEHLRSLGGHLAMALPTPSAFMSPAPNTVLSFLSPDTSLDQDSPNHHRQDGGGVPACNLNLSFGSLHSDSPCVSAEKPKQPSMGLGLGFGAAHSAHGYPPFHHDSSSTGLGAAGVHGQQHGLSYVDHLPSSASTAILCTPSTPPTMKYAGAKGKRQPPAAGSRAHDLPHISTGALRRKHHQPADGSAPLLKTRVTMGLSALLASPAQSPPLGPCAPPRSAPFAAMAGPADAATAIDADMLQLALEGENSLMQALNSAAKRYPGGAGRRLCGTAIAPSPEPDHEDNPPPSHMQSLSLPIRTASAPSPLQQLTSPMIARSGSMSAMWATSILPRLYLGNAKHAHDLAALRRHGVTHIINAADDVPNYYVGAFTYLNLNVADWGMDRGIRRVFKAVHQFVTTSHFIVTPEAELGAYTPPMPAPSSCGSSSSSPSPAAPVVILLHCAKGANRSVTVLLALLMLVYGWTLDRAHAYLLACRHQHTCPFPDNRQELIAFERQRLGRNTMTDKDFLTRFASD